MRAFKLMVKLAILAFITIKTFLTATEIYLYNATAFIDEKHPRNRRELYRHAYKVSDYITILIVALLLYLLFGKRNK